MALQGINLPLAFAGSDVFAKHDLQSFHRI